MQRRKRPKAWSRWRVACSIVVVGAAACVSQSPEESAIFRGDQAWARGDHEEALAEYLLAVRQGANSGLVHLRVAHAYVELGRVDEAKQAYLTAIESEPDFADQAVADLVRRARISDARDDRFGVASALEAALELRPGISFAKLALPMARHYAGNGEYERALPFFQKALAAADSAPEVVYEAALAYEQMGDCVRALLFFEEFAGLVRARDRLDADWHIGNCSYRLSGEYREKGDRGEALRLLQETVGIGEPKTLLASAYYDMGQLLVSLGRCEEAIDALGGVLRESPSGSGPSVRRAELWIDELRFGDRRRGRDRRELGPGAVDGARPSYERPINWSGRPTWNGRADAGSADRPARPVRHDAS